METEYFLKLFMFFVGVGLLVEAVRWLWVTWYLASARHIVRASVDKWLWCVGS